MKASTIQALDGYYSDLMDVEPSAIWQGVTAERHVGRLVGYEGFYVVWRDGGIHISVPADADPTTLAALRTGSPTTLQDPQFWAAFASQRNLSLIGPSMHAYLDVAPGKVDGVVPLTTVEVESLRPRVREEDWTESGWDDNPPHQFGLVHGGRLVAAANLNLFHHQPRDIGVLVASDMRGRGMSIGVAQHAAWFAITNYGFARWGARDTNAGSVAGARRLGFLPWCRQLAVR